MFETGVGIIGIFLIFFKMKVCCVFSLESPHPRDSSECTQYTNFFGKPNLSNDDNTLLFQAVHRYIKNTKRFV